MARNFNRPLTGLLGYLDQKSDGRNPAYLGETTQGVIDLDIWLRSQPEFFATNLAALPGVGLTTTINSGVVVPESETWLVWDANFSLGWSGVAPVAGNYASIQLCHVTPVAAIHIPIAEVDRVFFGGSAGPQLTFGAVSSIRIKPVILRPTEQLGAIASEFFPVGMTVVPRVTFKRLRFSA